MSSTGENYSARREAAQWSTLLAILTELRAIRQILESQQRGQWTEAPTAQVAPRPYVERPPQHGETDPAIGSEAYWPRGRIGSPRNAGPPGAHRA